MRTPRLVAALAVLLAVPAVSFADTAVNFDQGVDLSAFLSKAKAKAATDKAEIKTSAYPGGMRRTVPDCVAVTFSPNDAPESSLFHLNSTEWVEECTYTGDPRYGGGRQCWERPGYTYRAQASVSIRDRQALLPWEFDSFRVCLDGPFLSIDDIETAYDYKLVQGGNGSGRFVVAPVKKIAMRPDPVGVTGELSARGLFALKDRWTSYYAGETVEIKYTLKKHVKGWFDATIAQGSVKTAVAEAYALDFANQKLETGKDYYVQYQIRRIGKVSRDTFTKTLETGKTTYAPGLVASR